ncbi:MAG TPA: F0F1 ATP synthase subunit epsilon [Chloroflexi bacterium]|nr:F0F1 ATP synthase subunit epsilon [Chloroflexota bacterium]
MTISPLHLNVLTPTKTICDVEDVQHVHVHLSDGYPIGIYPGHAPLLAETVAGPLRYTDDSEDEHTINLAAGILHVDTNVVHILIGEETMETEEEIPDEAEAQTPLEEKPRFERLAQAMLIALQEKMQGTAGDER